MCEYQRTSVATENQAGFDISQRGHARASGCLTGWKPDDGLVVRVVNDTGAEPGNLTLTAFALSELYETRATDERLKNAPGWCSRVALGSKAFDHLHAVRCSVIEPRDVQAQVLVPLVKAL